MNLPTKGVVAILYGLLVVASGQLRYWSRAGGENAPWFGLVTGGLAVLGGLLLRRGHARVGFTFTALSLAFVSGWFTFEIFVKTGFGEAELRQKVVLSLALLTATALVLRKREPRMTA